MTLPAVTNTVISNEINQITPITSSSDYPGTNSPALFRRPRFASYNGDQLIAEIVTDPNTAPINNISQATLYLTGQSRVGTTDPNLVKVASFSAGSGANGGLADFLFAPVAGTSVIKGGVFWAQLNASGNFDIEYQQVLFDPTAISGGNPSVSLVGSPVTLISNISNYASYDFVSSGSTFIVEIVTQTSTGTQTSVQGFNADGSARGPQTLLYSSDPTAPIPSWAATDYVGNYQTGQFVKSGDTENLVLSNYNTVTGVTTPAATIAINLQTVLAASSRSANFGANWIYAFSGVRDGESYVEFDFLTANNQPISSFEIDTGDASAAVTRIQKVRLPNGSTTVWAFLTGEAIQIIEINGSGAETGNYKIAVPTGSTFDTITPLNDGRFEVEWRTPSSGNANVVNTQIFDSSAMPSLGASYNTGSPFSISAIPASLDPASASVVQPFIQPPPGVTYDAKTQSFIIDPSAYSNIAVGQQITIYIPYFLDVNGTTTLVEESFTMVGAYRAPTITGSTAGQTTTSEAPIKPFAGVVVADANPGATDTLTITLNGAGTLSGAGLTGSNGTYTLGSASAATITAELEALTFTPVAGVPNTSSTTTFTLADKSSAYSAATIDITTTVNDIDPAVKPSVTAPIVSAMDAGSAAYLLNLLLGATDANQGAQISVNSLGFTVDGVAANGVPAGLTLNGNALEIDPTSTAFRKLALGQTETIVATYQVADQFGNTTSQTATITITGAALPTVATKSYDPVTGKLLDVFTPGATTSTDTHYYASGKTSDVASYKNDAIVGETTYAASGAVTSIYSLINGVAQTTTYNADGSYESVASGITGKTYDASDTTYGTNGKLLDQKQVKAGVLVAETTWTSSGAVASIYSLTNGVAQTTTYHADGSSEIVASGITGKTYDASDTTYGTNGKLLDQKQVKAGVLVGETTYTASGAVSSIYSLTNGVAQTNTYHADGSYEIVASGITGKAYDASDTTYGTNGKLLDQKQIKAGQILSETASNADGSSMVDTRSIAGQSTFDETIMFADSNGKLLTELFLKAGSLKDVENLNSNGTLANNTALSGTNTSTGPFGGKSSIDLYAFAPSATVGFSEDASQTFGTLTLTQGNEHASIMLLGQYANTFANASDGHGGSIISYIPPQPTLAVPV